MRIFYVRLPILSSGGFFSKIISCTSIFTLMSIIIARHTDLEADMYIITRTLTSLTTIMSLDFEKLYYSTNRWAHYRRTISLRIVKLHGGFITDVCVGSSAQCMGSAW
jgi:hypothetical protein